MQRNHKDCCSCRYFRHRCHEYISLLFWFQWFKMEQKHLIQSKYFTMIDEQKYFMKLKFFTDYEYRGNSIKQRLLWRSVSHTRNGQLFFLSYAFVSFINVATFKTSHIKLLLTFDSFSNYCLFAVFLYFIVYRTP